VSDTGQIRIALAQINPTVGDLRKNSDLVSKYAFDAANAGAVVIAAVSELANRINNEGNGDLTLLVGYLGESDTGRPQNCVAVIYRGEVVATYIKHHLPNYGVFDEYRNFAPGNHSLVIRVCGVDIGIAICEDIWQSGGPVAELAKRNIGLLLVPNGSPFELNKDDARLALVQKRAMEIGAPLAYVNMTGGQDDLVFDGDTIVTSQTGQIIARAPQFEDGLMVIDLDVKLASSDPDLIISNPPILKYKKIIPGVARRLGELEQIWQGLVIGLKDYVEKNNFKSVILGLSGGIDSALVAALAADAIGANRVHGIAMPSKFSSDHSLSDAKALAINIGLNYRIIDIQPMVSNFIENLHLAGVIENLHLAGVAEENLQARVRGVTLMGLSNQEGHLVLATGNKSELAVGYSTLYGDAVGGFAPIKDLYKTQVWQLAKWRNDLAILQGEVPPIPENSINKEPSAELRPDQKDSDSLPDYKVLDQILQIYIDQDGGRPAALAAGFNPALVDKVVGLVDRAEYKRRQYPPGTKISSRAFGKDRRLPITSHWNES